jgi:hypothetical protein
VFCSWEDNHITQEDQNIDLKLPKFREEQIVNQCFGAATGAGAAKNRIIFLALDPETEP